MKRLLLFVLLAGMAASASSQSRPSFSTMGLYERYTLDGTSLAEASFPLYLVVPFTPSLTATLATTPATATGDAATTLGGLTDVQASLSYGIELGEARVTLSVRGNLPSGKRELSADEFNTAWQLSQVFYEFRVPGFGQGFNIGPGLTGAFPLSENLVVGGGISYMVRGPYSPLSTGLGSYDPGEELFVVGGFDYRLNPATSVSLDLTYTRYSPDQLEGDRTFEAGDKLTGAVQFRQLYGFHELRIAARYRNRSSSTLGAADGPDDELQTVPPRADLRATFRLRIDANLAAQFLLQGRSYGSTEDFDAQRVVDFGIAPSTRVTDHLTVQSRFRYTVGTFHGLQGGLGLIVEM